MNRVTRYFGYKTEAGQNPYTDFMSFQHFRGEKMYSDIVVRPDANRTETSVLNDIRFPMMRRRTAEARAIIRIHLWLISVFYGKDLSLCRANTIISSLRV